ncbi:hypothetical protein KC19_6G006100 [Ceratodon purpureus]|uniref:Uncharacterized protein n=1 Tax=Ceratodon purpureus TaxID=3225 RepID=A0A8T0HDM5_CERPU|nr:hypothetical protein KC19_6G006100 [Ceratodon purpureus]
MAEKKEDEDVEIIRNVLSVQHVPVVGSLAWDKLQFLLHSLCDRISSQAARLEKAEEQGKSLANFKDELNLLSQNAAAAAKADKEAEAQKQAKFLEVFETRLKALEELLAPLKAIPNFASILAQLGDMPKRVSVVEVGLQDAGTRLSSLDSHVHQIDNDLRELDSEVAQKGGGTGGGTDLAERIKSLEQQLEEFQALMNQITKAHTADLEAIQKVQRTLRAELEAKPLGQVSEDGSNNAGLNELQKRLERKADIDVVEQLIRASTNTKDGLEALARVMEELKKGIKNSTGFSVSTGSETDKSISNSGGGDDRIKKLEEALAALTNKLSTKADRGAIDEIQLKLASGGGGDNGGGGGDGALTDIIAKKVDRDEMQELMKGFGGGGSLKELMEKINAVNNSVVALAERSDLAVLLAKRAEQIAHPAATIHGAGGHTDDEEIQQVVNEHANRIMVYADMLLQMQVVLATKADNSTLSALRDIVDKMQAEAGGATKAALEAQEKTQEQMKATIKSHEKMLVKLLEDVGILGKGVLIMSGHDDEFHPDKFPPSPSYTPSSQGVIPSAPITPNSTERGNDGTKGGGGGGAIGSVTNITNVSTTQINTPSSTPASPPSSPNVQATSSVKNNSATSGLAVNPTLPTPPLPAASSEPIVSKPSQRPSANPALEAIEAAPKVVPISTTNKKRSITPTRKNSRFGTAGSTVRQASVLHITNIQEASQAVADSKYRETLSLLEDAINEKKLEPKENVAVLKRLVIEVEKMSVELENNLILIDNLEQGKVDKIDFQALAKIVKELKAMENAMLSGKPILGFKCMSCNHDLERLNPTPGPQIPTGQMPRSFLSMLSAERIFSMNKQDESPSRSPLSSREGNTRSNESKKTTKKQNT